MLFGVRADVWFFLESWRASLCDFPAGDGTPAAGRGAEPQIRVSTMGEKVVTGWQSQGGLASVTHQAGRERTAVRAGDERRARDRSGRSR